MMAAGARSLFRNVLSRVSKGKPQIMIPPIPVAPPPLGRRLIQTWSSSSSSSSSVSAAAGAPSLSTRIQNCSAELADMKLLNYATPGNERVQAITNHRIAELEKQLDDLNTEAFNLECKRERALGRQGYYTGAIATTFLLFGVCFLFTPPRHPLPPPPPTSKEE